MEPTQFLRNLYGEKPEGNIEIRVKANDGPILKRKFTSNPVAIAKLIKSAEVTTKSNRTAVFFGVGRRRDGAQTGTKADIHSVPALWADVDTVKLGWDTRATVKFLHALPFPIRPSICVYTGGGLHLYWMLDRSLRFGKAGTARWQERVSAFEETNQLVQTLFTSDRVHDITRVLRMPGTYNTKAVRVGDHYTDALKYATKVEVIWCYWWQTASLDDYHDAFASEAAQDPQGRVLGDGCWTTPEALEASLRANSGRSEGDLEGALRDAALHTKKQAPAGWDAIWDQCRYHAGPGYIGIDEAAMRATAFVWCRADDTVSLDALAERVLRRVQKIKDRDAPDEAWDWDKESRKIMLQLHRWVEKWSVLKRQIEAQARAERKAQREAAKREEARGEDAD